MKEEMFKPDHVIQAIRDTKGMVSLTAKRLNCHPSTVRNYAKRYPEIAKAIQEEREAMTDIAELSLYNKIQEGEAWAVCFYLKTQGRGRGYSERVHHEVTGADGGPIEISPARQKLAYLVDRHATTIGESSVVGELEGDVETA